MSRPDQDDPDELEELRELLFGRGLEELAELQHLRDPEAFAASVSEALPRAVSLRPPGDQELPKALMPINEATLHASVERDPDALADALYPSLGPAIRKSIASNLARAIRSLNQMVDSTFSPEGLRWRFQAWKEGKTFAEVVLANSLLYRVEQVFLIDLETGLPLHQVMLPELVDVKDESLVAGMLSAIQSFVHDSFSGAKEGTLQQIEVGEVEVWMETGPHALLAAVVRGTPPRSLRLRLQETLEEIHRRMAGELSGFEGDTTPFLAIEEDLLDCLVLETRAKEPRGISWPVVVLWVLLIGTFLFFSISWYRERTAWRGYLEGLRSRPGILLVEASASGSGYLIRGFKDPLAEDPALHQERDGFVGRQVSYTWEPFHSHAPSLALARARAILKPPAGVELELVDGRLKLSGEAPWEWARRAEVVAPVLPGVLALEADGLIRGADPWAAQSQEIKGLRGRLEGAERLARRARRWTGYEEWLRTQPGIEVEAVVRTDSGWRVSGARDPLAVDPVPRLDVAEIPRDLVEFQLKAAESAHPPYIRARAQEALRPPPGVTLEVAGDRLRVLGRAPHSWLLSAAKAAPGLTGISALDTSETQCTDSLRLQEKIAALEAQSLLFPRGYVDFDEAVYSEIATTLRSLHSEAEQLGRVLRVKVRGHSDSVGSRATNLRGSRLRAESVLARLRAEEWPGATWEAVGLADDEPLRPEQSREDQRFNRAVTLRISLSDESHGGTQRSG